MNINDADMITYYDAEYETSLLNDEDIIMVQQMGAATQPSFEQMRKTTVGCIWAPMVERFIVDEEILANHGHNVNKITGLSSVAISGSYNDLKDKPVIPQGTVTSVKVDSSSTIVSSNPSASTTTLDTTLSLADNYGDVKSPYASKSKNNFLAAPKDKSGVPTFRKIDASDLPMDSSLSATSSNPVKNSVIATLVPNEASSSNQLADKAFVNSSIATNTGNFRGTFDTLEELKAVSDPHNNDYGFVKVVDGQNTIFKRYKYNGTEWVWEYDLNNSSFTAAQWDAINSKITETLTSQISVNKQNHDTLIGNLKDGAYRETTTNITSGETKIPTSGAVYDAIDNKTSKIVSMPTGMVWWCSWNASTSLTSVHSLVCDGSLVSKTTYKDLYDKIGYSYTPWFKTGKSYAVGDYTRINSGIYKCIKATSENPAAEPSSWEKETVNFQLPDLKTDSNGGSNGLFIRAGFGADIGSIESDAIRNIKGWNEYELKANMLGGCMKSVSGYGVGWYDSSDKHWEFDANVDSNTWGNPMAGHADGSDIHPANMKLLPMIVY